MKQTDKKCWNRGDNCKINVCNLKFGHYIFEYFVWMHLIVAWNESCQSWDGDSGITDSVRVDNSV